MHKRLTIPASAEGIVSIAMHAALYSATSFSISVNAASLAAKAVSMNAVCSGVMLW